ncbi:MAG: SUMF1/EgtB/PvdO family nonheme iron enzyme [Deltaproteobacteria bacterium]|nr:SUMF1/EgtB/PvdO family nonheme iron enzyme [Deltaproteobacteria bacterium]
MSSIDWGNARAYCQWVRKRLPTEAEFERGARRRWEALSMGQRATDERARSVRFECHARRRDTSARPRPVGPPRPHGQRVRMARRRA